MTTWRERQHLPDGNQVHGAILTAFRVADLYRDRIPTPRQLMSDFDMSQATAYRWVRAMKDARGDA